MMMIAATSDDGGLLAISSLYAREWPSARSAWAAWPNNSERLKLRSMVISGCPFLVWTSVLPTWAVYEMHGMCHNHHGSTFPTRKQLTENEIMEPNESEIGHW